MSFEKAVDKIKEHYGIEVCKESVRIIAETHAAKIKAIQKKIKKHGTKVPMADVIVGEMDGGMVPVILGHKEENGDLRKTKIVGWCEGKLSLAYKQGSIAPVYNVTFGSVDDAGEQLNDCVKRAGNGKKTRIHCLGDGAPWIADQIERIFGNKATYLIDFWHLSQYLAEASQCCAPEDCENWRRTMQNCLKQNQINTVLSALMDHIATPGQKEHVCLAEKCYQYMIKRLNQFDYKGALMQDLPIGSGKAESGIKSVLQERLKMPGAWWDKDNLAAMASLRVVRINGDWEVYWTQYAKQTANYG